jgi:hypothetical protein
LIYDILPIVYNDDWGYDDETYYKDINHPITFSLPDSFVVPEDWSYSWTLRDTIVAKQAVTIYRGSSSGDAVVLGKYGTGEIIHWNMAGQYDGDNIWSPEVKTLLINITRYMLNLLDVEKELTIPSQFKLYQNYPNPFNPVTKIKFQIPEFGFVSLKVFDVLGNEVATLVNEERPAGTYEVEFNPASSIKHPASGIYFYQINTSNFVKTRKMLLLK